MSNEETSNRHQICVRKAVRELRNTERNAVDENNRARDSGKRSLPGLDIVHRADTQDLRPGLYMPASTVVSVPPL